MQVQEYTLRERIRELELEVNERAVTAKKEGGKKKTAPKADKPVKPALAKQAKPATAKQPKLKLVKEKSTKPTSLQNASKGKVTKVQNMKSSLQLVDEPDEEQAQPEPEPQEATRPLSMVEDKGKEIETEEQATQSLLALHAPKRRNAEIGADTDKVISEGDTEILNVT
nr:hypothetical protein [Tanacetum cinerariifolium]